MSASTISLSLLISLEMRVLIDLIFLAIIWYILLPRLSSNVKAFEIVRIFLRVFFRAFDEVSSLKQSVAVNGIRIELVSELKKKTEKSVAVAAINISSSISRFFSEISSEVFSEVSSEVPCLSTRSIFFMRSIAN